MLKAKGNSNRAIAARVGVTENAIREQLASRGWKAAKAKQGELVFDPPPAQPNLSASAADVQGTPSGEIAGGAQPNLSASETPAPLLPSFDADPSDRRFDRLLARMGMIDDAEPMFRPGTAVQGAGVLLAVPAIAASGVVECAREIYGSIGPAFYGLRTTIVALVLMALMRIKRPEGLKERPPDGFGRVLGLDRAPEVKTMRRKLARLAKLARAARFGRALAERRVREVGSALAFLYLDGHVR
ncbi:MAG: putative transposase, partial [Chloroflexota bacterium]